MPYILINIISNTWNDQLIEFMNKTVTCLRPTILMLVKLFIHFGSVFRWDPRLRLRPSGSRSV